MFCGLVAFRVCSFAVDLLGVLELLHFLGAGFVNFGV